MFIITGVAFAGDKVTVCHKENGNGSVCITKEIPVEALPAHLGHGDTLGPCDATSPTATPAPVNPTATVAATATSAPTATAVPPTATAVPTEKPIEPTATPVRIQPTATFNAISENPEGNLVADEACPSNGDCLCRVASALETQTALMATQTSLMATQTAQQAVCVPPSNNTGLNHSGMDLGLAALSDRVVSYWQPVKAFLSTPLGKACVVWGLLLLLAAAVDYAQKQRNKKTPKKDEVTQ